MLEGIKRVVSAKVGMAIYVDMQLEVGGHMCPILESGECVCV